MLTEIPQILRPPPLREEPSPLSTNPGEKDPCDSDILSTAPAPEHRLYPNLQVNSHMA